MGARVAVLACGHHGMPQPGPSPRRSPPVLPSRHRSLVASLVCADTYLQGTYTSAACTKGPGAERAHIGWKCLPFGAVRVGRGATAMVGVGAHRACQRDDEDGAKLHVCTPSSVARNVVHPDSFGYRTVHFACNVKCNRFCV